MFQVGRQFEGQKGYINETYQLINPIVPKHKPVTWNET